MQDQPSPTKMPRLRLLFLLLLASISSATPRSRRMSPADQFTRCVECTPGLAPPATRDLFCTRTNSSFNSLLASPANNLRYLTPSTPKPLLIFTPLAYAHVQAAVRCAKAVPLHLRLRSGGHDYEGLSYAAQNESPFIVIDFSRLRRVDVDLRARTAVVQAGATIGEAYYRIAEKNPRLGFPAGLCASLGVGGHITGGAYGAMMRKYGLGADNVVDVRMVDSDGEILDRKAMGEDRFWAIRGGGGGNFGAILEWTWNLVPVPGRVTVFTVIRTLEQGLTKLLTRWQTVAPALDEELFIRVLISPEKDNRSRTIAGSFNALYLGGASQLLGVMRREFPELGVAAADCKEMRWIESVVYIGGYPAGTPTDVLLKGKPLFLNSYKAKSDYVRRPIPAAAMKGLWKRMLAEESPLMILNPYGGMMARIPEDALPFPHRQGVLFKTQYVTSWTGGGTAAERRHMEWIREVYDFMTPYVSASPREAYLNYRDLDLGENRNYSALDGLAWGGRYYRNNIYRLVRIKTQSDPDNLYRHEQSIPLLPRKSEADGGPV